MSTTLALLLRNRIALVVVKEVANFKHAKKFLGPRCETVATHAALVHEPRAGACDGPCPHTTRGV